MRLQKTISWSFRPKWLGNFIRPPFWQEWVRTFRATIFWARATFHEKASGSRATNRRISISTFILNAFSKCLASYGFRHFEKRNEKATTSDLADQWLAKTNYFELKNTKRYCPRIYHARQYYHLRHSTSAESSWYTLPQCHLIHALLIHWPKIAWCAI